MTTEDLDRIVDTLEREAEELESEARGIDGEIDELRVRQSALEERASALRRRLNRLYAFDPDELDAILSGAKTVETPRMRELHRMVKRGLSWDDWAAINREYQQEAERGKQTVVELIEEAIPA